MIGWIALAILGAGLISSISSDEEQEYMSWLEDANEVDIDHRASNDFKFADYINRLWNNK